MVISDKVSVNEGGIHGYCWFAHSDIKKGETIWWLGDVEYNDITVSIAELEKWPSDKREKWLSLAYMCDENHYKGSDPNKQIQKNEQNEYFVNHSCDGNAWYNGDNEIVAMRDIKTGEEITYDYALTECNPKWILAGKCLCGTKSCRGKVTGNDWKLPELQQKYGYHFLPHILKLIEKSKQSEKENANVTAAAHQTKTVETALSTSSNSPVKTRS